MPYAQAYAGWQFGQFAGQLGDGRVVNLFEVLKLYQMARIATNTKSIKGAGKHLSLDLRMVRPCCGHLSENTLYQNIYMQLEYQLREPLH